MTLILGIDDAGRGPVLGPMILAGVLIEEKENSTLKKWGTKDSKLLTPKTRKKIKERIINQFKYHIEQTEPIEIDESNNLNYLEAIKAAKIINKLTEDSNKPVKVIIDCPSVNIRSWTKDVQKLINNPKNIQLSCEHKADLNHPSVSAASIVAKERREDEIYRLKRKFNINFGSGYPSDPTTKEFITENFNNQKYKSLIRFSWKTVKKLFEEVNQEKLF